MLTETNTRVTEQLNNTTLLFETYKEKSTQLELENNMLHDQLLQKQGDDANKLQDRMRDMQAQFEKELQAMQQVHADEITSIVTEMNTHTAKQHVPNATIVSMNLTSPIKQIANSKSLYRKLREEIVKIKQLYVESIQVLN